MAYLQARSGIARSGVTYAGWTGAPIVRGYLAGADQTTKILLEGWTLTLLANQPPTFSFRTKTITPVTGSDVQLKYSTPNEDLFGGTLLQLEAAPEAPDSAALIWHGTAVGYQWLLDRYDRVLAQYDNVGVGTMVADILHRFTDGGFRVGYCPSSLGNLTMTFNFETVWQALMRIARAAGNVFIEVTPERIVNLYSTYPEAALATVTGDGVVQGTVRYRKDLTQVRTRTLYRGQSTTVSQVVAAGASTIPVQDSFIFPPGPALAIAGRNLISYLFRQVGLGTTQLIGCTGVLYDIAAGEQISVIAEAEDAAARSALAAVLGGSYRDTVVDDGPKVYLRLDDMGGTTADDEINAHDGTYSGSPTLSQVGLISSGTAVQFDGVDDFIAVADHADLDITTGLTLEAWIYPDAYDVAFPRILAKGSSSGSGYQLLIDRDAVGGARLSWQLQGLTTATANSSAVLSTGTAYHIVVTYDGSNVRIYINGVLDTTTPATGSITTNGTALFIGQRGDGTARWHGRLDEVAVYNVVLDDAQVAEHYGLRTTVGLSGQATHVLEDSSLTYAEALARGQADLAVFSKELEELSFTNQTPQRDIRVGRTISVNFSTPFALARDFTVRGLTITPRGKLGASDYDVWQQVDGSGFVRTLQELLQQLPG